MIKTDFVKRKKGETNVPRTKISKEDIEKKREYIVAKSHAIVQKNRYSLTVNEQKTLAYICSLIRPAVGGEDTFVLDYEFDISQYAKICGISSGGRTYADTKAILKGLRDKSMWLTLENGSETVVGWLDRVMLNRYSGKVKVHIDERLAPYLFNLKDRYLTYELKNILKMHSRYSIRLYELLKSYHDMKASVLSKKTDAATETVTYSASLDELRKLLMVEGDSYAEYRSFRRRILEPAEEEINRLTDITVSTSPVMEGRKAVGVEFSITKNNLPVADSVCGYLPET